MLFCKVAKPDFAEYRLTHMASQRIFAGGTLRHIRATRNLRQADMAQALGISAAYLSQLENDDRPLTSSLIDRLRTAFPSEWQDVPRGDALPIQMALQQAANSPLLGGDVSATQARRLAEQFPDFAQKFIALERLHRQGLERLAMLDEALGSDAAAGGRLPWEEVRDWFHNANNYVDVLDRRAERMASELAGGVLSPSMDQMAGWLEKRGIALELREGSVLRSFDATRRVVTLDSVQPPQSARFHLAGQIASIALRDEIAEVVGSATLRTETARELLTVGLSNYAAGAMILPYEAFRAAAREVRHDIDQLRWRFGASLEQVCHRLSSLQRPGARGTPAFFCRVDMAGNITKRHSATRLEFARFGGACPLWIVHEAVALPGRTHVQLAEMPDGARYVSIAIGVVKDAESYRQIPRRYALGLGFEAAFAADFVYADGIDVSAPGSAVPIGTSCRICPRDNCEQRAYPPSDRDIVVSTDERAKIPYRIAPAQP